MLNLCDYDVYIFVKAIITITGEGADAAAWNAGKRIRRNPVLLTIHWLHQRNKKYPMYVVIPTYNLIK